MGVSPAYVYRPTQAIRRLRRPRSGETVVRLPWGARLVVSADEHVGGGIVRRGIHELAVTELLWRLARPGALALDVGANIGYFSSLLVARGCRVVAFEPEPTIRARLKANVPGVTVNPCAVSDRDGSVTLIAPDNFDWNQGSATVGDGDGLSVQAVTLDGLISEPVRVMKIDVEGHELTALRGAERLLSRHLISHIVFEDHNAERSAVFALLRSHGYELFGLHERLRGLRLVDPLSPDATGWDAPNYLATVDPDETRAALRGVGWRSLGPT